MRSSVIANANRKFTKLPNVMANFDSLRWKKIQYAIGLVLLIGGYVFVVSHISATNARKGGNKYGSYIIEDRKARSVDDPHTLVTGNTTRPANTAKKSKKGCDTMFFRTAVVITQPKGGVGVRVTSLQECGNKRKMKLRIAEFFLIIVSFPGNSTSENDRAQEMPLCNLVGYFATGSITDNDNQTLPLPSIMPEFAEVYDDRRAAWKRIDLIDGRSENARPHRLAVCLQPVYLMADWPLIPNFFETWIGNGATIFYIYVHSISEEVDLMIKLYEAQDDIEVVRVNWPAVPTTDDDEDDRNPNNRMYRTEVGTAVNDCLLRARAAAELAVSSDLDEIIAPLNLKGNNETLFDIIDDYQARKLKKDALPGAFLFRQSYAYAENDWFSISHPGQLKFDHYRSVDYEKKVWQRGYRSKVIYFPDRVFRAHVHDVVAYEEKGWATAVIDPNRARLLHFRQVSNRHMKKGKVTAGSSLFREAAVEWQAAYAARLAAAIESEDAGNTELQGAFNLTFTTAEWPNLGGKVLNEIEVCREKNQESRKNQCVTEWHCRSTMQSIRPGQWVEPDSAEAWTVI